MKNKSHSLLIVLGGGGHTTQMIRLVDKLGNKFNYEYVISKTDSLSKYKIKIPGKIWYITKPRSFDTPIWKAVINTIMSFIDSFKIMFESKSSVIITAGPGVAVALSYVGKIFFRKKIIFLESWSRVWHPSRTGKIIYPISDLFFVQWKELKKKYQKAIYAGRLG